MSAPTIRGISARGLKLAELEVDLGRLTLALGPVGSGKTTIGDVIQYVATGGVPRVGMSFEKLALLLNGDGIDAAIKIRGDKSTETLTRRMIRDSKGGWTGPTEASWLQGASLTDASKAIRALFGATDEEAQQNLDIVRLLVGPSFAANLERLLDGGKLDPAALGKRFGDVFTARLETLRPKVDGLLLDLPAPVAAAAATVERLGSERVGGGIPDAITWAAGKKKEHTAAAKEASASRDALQKRLKEIKAPAETAELLRDRRAKAAGRQTEITTTLKLHRDGAAARAAAAAEVAKAETDLANAEANLKARQTAALEVAGLQASLAQIIEPADPTPPATYEIDRVALDAACAPQRDALAALVDPPEVAAPTLAYVDQEALNDETADLRGARDALVDPLDVPPQPTVQVSAEELKRAEALLAEADGFDRLAAATVIPAVPDAEDEELALVGAERELRSAEALPWLNVAQLAGLIRARAEASIGLPAEDREFIQGRCELLRQLAFTNGGDLAALTSAVATARAALDARRAEIAQATTRRDEEARGRDHLIERASAKRNEAMEVSKAAAAEVARLNAELRAGWERAQAEVTEARKVVAAERRRLDAEIAAVVARCNAQVAQRNTEARAAFEGDRNARAEIVAANAAVRKQLTEALGALERDAQAKVDDANRQLRALYSSALAQTLNAKTAAANARAEIQGEINRLESAVRVAERCVRDAGGILDAAKARRAGLSDALPVDEVALETEAAELATALPRLDEQLTLARGADVLRDELKTLTSKLTEDEAYRDAYTCAEWALTRVRDEDMSARSGGLEGRMRKFLAPALDAEPFVRCAGGKCRVGLRFGEHEVDASALSGGQGALFRAALAYAVLAVRNPTIKLLTIELAEDCDGELEDKVLRCCEAVAEDVQCLVMTCVPIAEPDPARGWKIVRMTGKSEGDVAHAS